MTRRCPNGQCLSLWSSQLTDPLVTDYLLYFSQPRPAVANYSEIPLRSDKIIYMQSNDISVVYSVCSTCHHCLGSIMVLITGMWKCIGCVSFACGFRFSSNFFVGFSVYDSSRLPTVYSAADNIPRARFPTPRALLERYLQFFFFCRFYRVNFSEGF